MGVWTDSGAKGAMATVRGALAHLGLFRRFTAADFLASDDDRTTDLHEEAAAN
jgi:hypothetical protein